MTLWREWGRWNDEKEDQDKDEAQVDEKPDNLKIKITGTERIREAAELSEADIKEAKEVLDAEKVIASILLVEDLSRQKN